MMHRTERETALQYLARGPHEVDVVAEYMLHDAARAKQIPLRLYVPRGGGSHPLIVFSHGAGDSNASSPLLMRHWASRGYAVILPTHLFGPRPILERSILRLREELLRPREMGPAAWQARTDDVRSILDHIPTLIGDVPALAGGIDMERIAVAGHSFGAYTVLLLGGATLTDPESKQHFHFTEPRARAVLGISGPGSDEMGLTKDSWKTLARPLMVFTGSRDPGYVFGCGAAWRAEPFTYGPAGDKYLVHIRGAHHLSYIGPIFDIPLRDPSRRGAFAEGVRSAARVIARALPAVDQTGIFDYVRIASAAFWDAHLRDSSDARRFLCSQALDAYSGRNVRTEHK